MTAQDRHACFTAEQVREMDRRAIIDHGVPGFTLMQRAGMACFNVLLQHWPQPARVLVCCGTGNNGGDGFVIAALCRQRGMDVMIFLAGNSIEISGDALLAWQMAQAARVPVYSTDKLAATLAQAPADSVIVDALLGTGLKGEVRSVACRCIEQINASGLPVLAVDIPSGLCSDSGEVLGVAVQADATVTFIGRKCGQYLGAGKSLCGELYFDTLDVPAEVRKGLIPVYPDLF